MPNTCRRPRLAQKAKLRRSIPEISLTDDFERYRAAQIDVERFISDSHRTATQLDRFSIFTRHQFVVLKSLHSLFRCCRLDRFLGSGRLAGLSPVSSSPAQHADRTEFHCSRKLIAAGRTAAWSVALGGFKRGVRFHTGNTSRA